MYERRDSKSVRKDESGRRGRRGRRREERKHYGGSSRLDELRSTSYDTLGTFRRPKWTLRTPLGLREKEELTSHAPEPSSHG